MKNPLISVIMPIYNAESTVSRAVDSILQQTFSDFELILVNDGSTDSSLEICRTYEANNRNIKVIDQLNGGVSSARNAGMAIACGDWITFCDSDDFVDPVWLENFARDGVDDYSLIVQSLKIHRIFKCENGEMEKWSESFDTVRIDRGIYFADHVIGLLRKKYIFGFVYLKLYKTEIIRRNNIHFHSGVTFREDELFNIEYISMISGQKVLFTGTASYNYNYELVDVNKKYILTDYLFKTVQVLREKYPIYNLEARTYAIDRYFELVTDSFRCKYNSKMKLLKDFHVFIKEKSNDSVPTEYRLNKLSQRILKLPGGVYLVYIMLSLIRL